MAYVSHFEDGRVADFLYLKIETEAVEDVVPVLPAKRRLKVRTFKLLSRGTRRGEQMMEIVMKRAKEEKMEEIYATIFPKEELKSLVRLFEKYGFRHVAEKPHPMGFADLRRAGEVAGGHEGSTEFLLCGILNTNDTNDMNSIRK